MTPDELVRAFAGACVHVVGDAMLDEYVQGETTRISPEAPVQVVRVAGTFHRPGGAAHVAHCVAALGARARLCAVVGNDPAGAMLRSVCESGGIDTAAVGVLDSWMTVRKLRVVAPRQQLLRLDWERDDTVATSDALTWLAHWDGTRPDVLVVSDYAKGMLPPATVRRVIDDAVARGVPVLVDPKQTDLTVYRGATVLTPNLPELERALGRRLIGNDIVEAARSLVANLGLQAVVVTMGADGMLLVPRDGRAERIPARRREVFDVTGAGDVVLATLALGLAVNAPLGLAAHVANVAAGITVMHTGTRVVTTSELLAALGVAVPTDRVVDVDALVARVAAWRAEGKRIVFTNGCFDLLHTGHVALLREARTHGDVLVVGVNGDDSVTRLKGAGRPVVPFADRAVLLAAIEGVDAVVRFDSETPAELIARIEPDVLVKGGDYRVEQVVGRDVVEARGGRVVIVALVPGRSTSSTVAGLRGG